MLLALGVWLACAPADCGRTPPTRPHLVLVVVDSLRADHLGAYGYPRPTSPNFDRLAAAGTLFLNAFAPSSWTRPSVASLFTSRLPSEHGAVTVQRPLDAALPTLAGRLREAGYATIGVSGNFVHLTSAAGFARGFDRFDSFPMRDRAGRESLWQVEPVEDSPTHLRAPHAREINERVLRWLPPAGAQPLFLYVHYMEPHPPFAPPERLRRRFAGEASEGRPAVAENDLVVALAAGRRALEPGEREWLIDLYDAEIAAVDQALGELVAALEARGLGSDTVLVVTADHGEELGDHGSFFHGRTLHSESLRVPLLVHDARSLPGGERREDAVDLLDVPTTLLELAGASPAPGMRGRALLAGARLEVRRLVAELHPDPRVEENAGSRIHRIALAQWPWKAIVRRGGGRVLYRMDTDREEQEPVAASLAPPELLGDLDALERGLDAPGAAQWRDPLDPRSREALHALGYVR